LATTSTGVTRGQHHRGHHHHPRHQEQSRPTGCPMALDSVVIALPGCPASRAGQGPQAHVQCRQQIGNRDSSRSVLINGGLIRRLRLAD
jgi:hypothetical protein